MAKEIKPKELVKFFQKQGFSILYQKGSHVRLKHLDGRKITIALHNKSISKGTLSAILRQAQLSKEKFVKLFRIKKRKK